MGYRPIWRGELEENTLRTVRSPAAAARAVFLRGTAVERRGAAAKAARRIEEIEGIA